MLALRGLVNMKMLHREQLVRLFGTIKDNLNFINDFSEKNYIENEVTKEQPKKGAPLTPSSKSDEFV